MSATTTMYPQKALYYSLTTPQLRSLVKYARHRTKGVERDANE